MFKSIQITNQDVNESQYSYSWSGPTLTINHDMGSAYFVMLKDENDAIVFFPTTVQNNVLIIDFINPLREGETFSCNLFSVSSSIAEDEPEEQYYSGTQDHVLLFCKSLDISEDRLATVDTRKINEYQQIVDDAIDGYLCEYYFVPLSAYNQVQRNGSIKKVFPGKIRFLAIQWVAGLLIQSEFQNMEPNANEQGIKFIEEAKKEMQQMVDFSTRIPGQRRKHPCPTMPPNLAPSKTNEFIL